MPILNDNPLGPIKRDFARGNLIVKFDIEFPSQLSEEQKQELTDILNEDEWIIFKWNFLIILRSF